MIMIPLSIFASLPACFKHPVNALHNQAMYTQDTLSEKTPEIFSDNSYFIPQSDALTVTATSMANYQSIISISESKITSDWNYSGSLKINETGEIFIQTKTNNQISLISLRGEISLHGESITEERIITSQENGNWSKKQNSKIDINFILLKLSEIEKLHLENIVVTNASETINDFEKTLPNGFIVKNKSESSITIEKITTKTRKDTIRNLYATWDMREAINVKIKDNKIIRNTILEHRFSTEESKGLWERSNYSNQAVSMDWLGAALRIALPAHHVIYGEPLLNTTNNLNIPPSSPPPIPTLRTMEQIEQIITRRAWQNHKGNFTICLDRIIINPLDWNGEQWDLPLVDSMVSLTQSSANVVQVSAGQLNAIADSHPILSAIADGGMAYMTSDMIDRKQVEVIASITSNVAGWTRQLLPVQPDLSGTYSVGHNIYQLINGEDSFISEQNICQTVNISGSNPIFSLSLWDLDLSEHDPIGQCYFSFSEITNNGITGIACGYARAYMHAIYNFDFNQIKVVGLPRP